MSGLPREPDDADINVVIPPLNELVEFIAVIYRILLWADESLMEAFKGAGTLNALEQRDAI